MSKYYSEIAGEIWREYADLFQRRWGIDHEVSAVIGARSKSVCHAEFAERGKACYGTSVLLPIRNAFYAASVMDARWPALKAIGLEEPILDYGCGVGFQLLWLKRHGLDRLFAYELPGVQREIMLEITGTHGIGIWDRSAVSTVICTNVLEHVARPLALLKRLLAIGKRVIANVCVSHDAAHIAPHDQLEQCRAMLEERGTLYAAD